MRGYLTIDLLISIVLVFSLVIYISTMHLVTQEEINKTITEQRSQIVKFYDQLSKFYSKFSSKLNEYTHTAYVPKDLALKWYYLCIRYYEPGLRCKNTSIGSCPLKPMLNYESNYFSSTDVYKRFITIDNSGNPTLTDYQIKIVIDTQTLISQGKLNPDCSNIQFRDSDDSTELPYFIEPDTCNTSHTIIWVKVPNIPGNSVKTIYMYYGKHVTGTNDPAQVFDFFDDFPSGYPLDTSKWDVTGSGFYSVEGGYLILYGNTACPWCSNFGEPWKYLSTETNFSLPIRVIVNFYTTTTSSMLEDLLICFESPLDCVDIDGYFEAPIIVIDGSRYYMYDPLPDTHNHRIEVIFEPHKIKLYQDWSGTWHVKSGGSLYSSGNVIISADTDSSSQHVYVDWIAVTKYHDPEPSVIVGSEVSAIPAGVLDKCYKLYVNSTSEKQLLIVTQKN